MESNFQNLSEASLNHLIERLLAVARDYERWADYMLLGGAGDSEVGQFPFGLDEIERIDITMEGVEEP